MTENQFPYGLKVYLDTSYRENLFKSLNFIKLIKPGLTEQERYEIHRDAKRQALERMHAQEMIDLIERWQEW